MSNSAIPSHLMDNFDTKNKPLIYSFKKYDDQITSHAQPDIINILTEAIDLDGMQKEAFVSSGRNSSGWRIPTDESLHLRGADAAPQPLALHNAAVQICLLDQCKRVLNDHQVTDATFEITVDTYFNIKGSFFRGDIKSCLKDIVIKFNFHGDLTEERVKMVVLEVLRRSPTVRALHLPMQNTFSIRANGRKIPLPSKMQSGLNQVSDPLERIKENQKIPPLPNHQATILEKKALSTMEPPKEGEIPVGLLPEIDRTIHIRGMGSVLNDHQNTVQTSFFHPLGSIFAYQSDWSDRNVSGTHAPSALSYHGAALAFCFMTQFHRYADVNKIDIDALRIVQLTPFYKDTTNPTTLSFDTHIFVDGNFSDEIGTDIVRMAHQVCFLHAALESENAIHYSIALNAVEIAHQMTYSNGG